MRRRCPTCGQARLRLHHRCGKDRPLSMAFGVRHGADAAEGTESWLRMPLSETRIPLFRDIRESLLP
jgi:hypothetical protein